MTFDIGTIAVAFVISIDNNKPDSHGFRETPRQEAFKHDITSLQHISRDKIPRATASWAKI
ncbi:hypothetical protein BPAE_0012g00160 [Botrytis paeoniae]|uniref:Uncharacterized protein n=1 Tax=Botrytis paeoniae TaxID=278948 RepID=A0A4Z1G2R4_9HELO|nr:hypothetical protein BPAE_0012g00160 [Botrytis paeoniae]